MTNDINRDINENVIQNNEINNTINEDVNELDDNNLIENDLENKNDIYNPTNTMQLENEMEKRFAKINYKTFDVRYIKAKMWDSINQVISLQFIKFLR